MECYVMLEMPGIQQYITSTGKLKELVGGSEVVESLSNDYLDSILKQQMKLRRQDLPESSSEDWYISLQRAAGTIRLVLPKINRGRELIKLFTLGAKEKYPGLPLLGALAEFDWDTESLSDVAVKVNKKISRKRSKMSLSQGLPLLPVCRTAKLDGAAATMEEKDGVVSLVSAGKRKYIEKSNKRLRDQFDETLKSLLPDVTIEWGSDFENIFGREEHSYMALVHIDGNDMGDKVQKILDDNKQVTDSTTGEKNKNSNLEFYKFSSMIEEANKEAFKAALKAAVSEDIRKKKKPVNSKYIVPLRPLVMGGDDLTVVIRADLAFVFTEEFARKFTEETTKKDSPLSVGVGMVICNHSYPFARAFHLAEELIESAKRILKKAEKVKCSNGLEHAPSGLDFLVMTSEMEPDLESIRKRVYTGKDKELLTSKPLLLHDGDEITKFVKKAEKLAGQLPRNGLKRSVDACRAGKNEADILWRDMFENLNRGLGGRKGEQLMFTNEFENLFGPKSFFKENTDKSWSTDLVDIVEIIRFVEEDAA